MFFNQPPHLFQTILGRVRGMNEDEFLPGRAHVSEMSLDLFSLLFQRQVYDRSLLGEAAEKRLPTGDDERQISRKGTLADFRLGRTHAETPTREEPIDKPGHVLVGFIPEISERRKHNA